MDKRGQIPGKSPPPNAAPKADVDRVRARVDALGYEWHDAIKRAGLSYSTGYRFLNYEASVGKLRELEEWIVREESKRNRKPLPTGEEQDERLAEWATIGAELMKSDPQRFNEVLDGLRDVLEATKLTQNAFLKILRATPGNDR
jgi:hypothetical protein